MVIAVILLLSLADGYQGEFSKYGPLFGEFFIKLIFFALFIGLAMAVYGFFKNKPLFIIGISLLPFILVFERLLVIF